MDRELAKKARDADRDISEERQEQGTLENYYDRMADLLLTHDLRSKTGENDEERSIARARTLTVLRNLNAAKKGQVIRFLYESKLIDSPNPVIVLREADFTFARLYDINLSRSSLSGTYLGEARLLGANLSKADLFRTALFRANLNETNLSHADLEAADLHKADLSGADLSEANLSGGRPEGSQLVQGQPERGRPEGGQPERGQL